MTVCHCTLEIRKLLLAVTSICTVTVHAKVLQLPLNTKKCKKDHLLSPRSRTHSVFK